MIFVLHHLHCCVFKYGVGYSALTENDKAKTKWENRVNPLCNAVPFIKK